MLILDTMAEGREGEREEKGECEGREREGTDPQIFCPRTARD